jgi:hypothetical protein
MVTLKRIGIVISVAASIGCRWGESDLGPVGAFLAEDVKAVSLGIVVSAGSEAPVQLPFERLSPASLRAAHMASMENVFVLRTTAAEVYIPELETVEGHNAIALSYVIFNNCAEPMNVDRFLISVLDGSQSIDPAALGVFQPDGADFVYCDVDDLACTMCGLSNPREASKEDIGGVPKGITIPANSSVIVSCCFRINALRAFNYEFNIQNGETSCTIKARYAMARR